MAQVIFDGYETAVVKVHGPETIDISTLFKAPSTVSIERVVYDVGAATDVQVLWDATIDELALTLSGRDTMCFESFRGLTNNAGAGVTGDVVIVGTAPFTIVFHFHKNY